MGPSLMCALKGNAYLTGRQNTGVVASGFDTFNIKLIVKDETHIHFCKFAWGKEPRDGEPANCE